ncbi:siderophore-interacting protein [Pantoea sp. 18069]|uniref:siderophore-interacting protein n=1 Tax=Pantoea sp. 18069 TaxID=2681415 RepID=UPI001359982E|nr:siderophore-interacting protein [Pantoea sp. 18069]
MTLLQARTCVRTDQAQAMVQTIVEHMREHDLAPQREGARWTMVNDQGLASLWAQEGSIHASASASGIEALQDIKLMLAHLILDATGSDETALIWDGDGGALQRPPAFRLLRVLSVQALTPHMQRVRLGCDDLARYAQDENIHCKLIFPQPGVTAPEWPTLSPSGMPRFPQGDKRLDVRTYTMRAIDGAAGWLDVDFVLHPDAGPGSAWAAQASVGQQIGMSGPGGRTAAPADWMLLAGDDTALPAMLRIAASLPPHTQGHVFAEIQGPQDEQPVRAPQGLQWHWLYRGQAAAGTTGLLLDALRGVPWPQARGTRFVWAGAEFEAAQAIRQWARETRGLEKHEQLIVSYWRHGMAEHELKKA